jgi:glucose uptake protein GlcU
MSKRDRTIYAIVVLILILSLMGYVTYLRVLYDIELDIGLGLLATAIGYMLRWIHAGNGDKNHNDNNHTETNR